MESNDDLVGYGKPPKKDQFKKGQSGNPAGRPKGTTHFPWLVLQAMDRSVDVKNGDSFKTMRMQKVIAERLVRAAAAGDPKAQAELLRIEDQYRSGYESHKVASGLNAKKQRALSDEIYSYYPPVILQVAVVLSRFDSLVRKNLPQLRKLRAMEQHPQGEKT